jgi:GAF domain-containing protein
MGAAPDDRLDRERAEALLTGENQLLERLVQGENLESILDGVCRMVEGIFSDSFVSIMLVNPDDHRLWYAASGSLRRPIRRRSMALRLARRRVHAARLCTVTHR